MSVLLVTYDLKGNDGDYPNLIEAIKTYKSYCHAQKSVWFLDTSRSVGSVKDDLKQYIHREDDIFVGRIQKEWASYQPSTVNTWLMDIARSY
ncbi:hypothetical protein [Saccharibacter floricola]|nr:hypothetical protein [Saccharibacter floricola]